MADMVMHCPTHISRTTTLAAAIGLAWALALSAPDAAARSSAPVPGRQPTAVDIRLSDIAQGRGGFVIHGEPGNAGTGYSVSSAGDVNADGLTDLIIGDPSAALNGQKYSGRAYVVFGKTGTEPIELSQVAAGIGGFTLDAASDDQAIGISVAGAGDVNGDGLADLIVYGSENCCTFQVGHVYVVFGKTDTAPVKLDAATLAQTRQGFAVEGFGTSEYVSNVAAAGDVNGDGLDDLIAETPTDRYYHHAGEAYVVFGKFDSAPVEISDIKAGTGGFLIQPDGHIGARVSGAGDVNGDGLADVILGQEYQRYGEVYESYSYVVFGKSDTQPVDLREVRLGNGGGFVILGANGSTDASGINVAGAGDVNGDGRSDLLVGATHATPFGGGYVVFGKDDTAPVSLDKVAAGTGGFLIRGEDGHVAGLETAPAGDVDGDGLADVLIGAEGDGADRTYLVYGKADTSAVRLSDVAAGHGGIAIIGETRTHMFGGNAASEAGDVNGDGLSDLVVGDDYAGTTGTAYVIFGGTTGAFRKSQVDQLGGSGDDTLAGTSRSDVLVGGAGDDTLVGLGGSDVLIGGPGDDTFVIDASNVKSLSNPFGSHGNRVHLARLDGGTGYDTLRLSGAGITLDLGRIAGQGAGHPASFSRLESIEHVDMTGSGDNRVVLGVKDVQDMAGMNRINRGTQAALGWTNGSYVFPTRVRRHQLVIDGNAGDMLNLQHADSGWVAAGTVFHGGTQYTVYDSGTSGPQFERVEVIVASDVTTIIDAPARPPGAR